MVIWIWLSITLIVLVTLAAELDNAAELSRGRGNRGYTLLGLRRYDEALEDIQYSLDLYRQQGRLEGHHYHNG
ncbi:MAG: hypothetical protein R3C44_17470 [Chloroflexota bacterium]